MGTRRSRTDRATSPSGSTRLASLLTLLLVLSGCAGGQLAAPAVLSFGAGDPRAVVLVGISAGQRDGTLTFTRLADGSNRLMPPSEGNGAVQFSISNDDAAAVFVVSPGRYLVSEASIVTGRGEEYRRGYDRPFGYHYGLHPSYFHHGWFHDWGPRRVTVTEGERFRVKDGPRGIENRSWLITVPPGQVTALGHFAFEWTPSNNVLNVAQTPFDERALTLALAPYPGVTAPVVEADWTLYGPDLPPPPMMHWSRSY